MSSCFFERHSEKAFLKIFIYLFIYFFFNCTGSLLLQGFFSSFREWRLLSRCGTRASHCGSFSCLRARALGWTGFSRCSSRAQWSWCMWDLPGPGIASIGRWIFTTEPLGKPEKAFFAVVVTAFMFLFHNDTSIDLGNIVNLNNS